MPSAPRGFQADVPVLITTRCVLRADFFNDENLEKRLRQLMAQFALRCGVTVFAWVLMRNHLHLLLAQRFPGHDARGKKGLSPFLRNVFSVLAKYANGYQSTQGHVFARTFHSKNRPEAEEVFAAFAYILTNPLHHHATKRLDGYAASAARTYFSGEPDGAVNAILGLFGKLRGTPQEKGAIIRRLVQEWASRVEAAGEEADKVAIARAILRENRSELDLSKTSQPIPIASWVGKESADRAVEVILRWVPVKRPFAPQLAPRLNELIGHCSRERGRPASWDREDEAHAIA